MAWPTNEQGTIGNASSFKKFSSELAPAMTETAKLADRLGRYKKLDKQIHLLNVTEIRKMLEELQDIERQLILHTDKLRALMADFQLGAAESDSAAWSESFIRACNKSGQQVDGEFPIFRVFPLEVKVDFAHDLVQINNRTVRALGPEAVAELVAAQIDKLNRERFNANQFMKALVRAYHVVRHEWQAAHPQQSAVASMPIKRIYEVLTIRTGTSAYTLNQFIFDIYRLRTGETLQYGEYALVFGDTRTAGESLTIPMPGGTKQLVGSLELTSNGEDTHVNR